MITALIGKVDDRLIQIPREQGGDVDELVPLLSMEGLLDGNELPLELEAISL